MERIQNIGTCILRKVFRNTIYLHTETGRSSSKHTYILKCLIAGQDFCCSYVIALVGFDIFSSNVECISCCRTYMIQNVKCLRDSIRIFFFQEAYSVFFLNSHICNRFQKKIMQLQFYTLTLTLCSGFVNYRIIWVILDKCSQSFDKHSSCETYGVTYIPISR